MALLEHVGRFARRKPQPAPPLWVRVCIKALGAQHPVIVEAARDRPRTPDEFLALLSMLDDGDPRAAAREPWHLLRGRGKTKRISTVRILAASLGDLSPVIGAALKLDLPAGMQHYAGCALCLAGAIESEVAA